VISLTISAISPGLNGSDESINTVITNLSSGCFLTNSSTASKASINLPLPSTGSVGSIFSRGNLSVTVESSAGKSSNLVAGSVGL